LTSWRGFRAHAQRRTPGWLWHAELAAEPCPPGARQVLDVFMPAYFPGQPIPSARQLRKCREPSVETFGTLCMGAHAKGTHFRKDPNGPNPVGHPAFMKCVISMFRLQVNACRAGACRGGLG
jgi:hypothetical protein